MEIREIRPSDAKQFEEFYETLIKQTDYLIPTWDETAEREGKEEDFIRTYGDYKQVFVAIKDGKIAGYLGISRSHLAKIRHVAHFTVGVLQEYTRQGIAGQLIAHAEKWAAEKGVTRLEITVISENEAAIALFEKNNYQKEGIRKNSVRTDNGYYDEIFMAKTL